MTTPGPCPECGSTDTYTDYVDISSVRAKPIVIPSYNHCRHCEAEAKRGGWPMRYRAGDLWVRIDRSEWHTNVVL